MRQKKYVMALMLAGFAALNTGFTSQVNSINTTELTAVEETNVIPSAEINTVKEIEQPVQVAENITELKIQAAEVDVNNIEMVESEPVRQNIVETSYGAVSYSSVMSMEATAYLPTDGSGSGITATGVRAAYGVVAVDPRVIPLGTKVYIPGYGVALAADTGGAIKGYKIDLCMESYSECMRFGRRNVTVYVLE